MKKTQNFALISERLKSCKKMHTQKVIRNPMWWTWVKVEKVHFSIIFLSITFCAWILLQLFQQFWNLHFFISFLIFKNKFLGHLKPLFANFEAKSAQNGSKNTGKNAFSKLVFNLHVISISALFFSIFSKKFKITLVYSNVDYSILP